MHHCNESSAHFANFDNNNSNIYNNTEYSHIYDNNSNNNNSAIRRSTGQDIQLDRSVREVVASVRRGATISDEMH